MGRLVNGELATVVPQQNRRDEIGEMAQSVEIFRQGLTEAETLRAAMRSVGAVIERARESTVTIASAVEEQQAATSEIASSIQSVSANSATVEESCIDTDSRIVDLLSENTAVQDSADRLTVSATDLRSEMDRFFERFRDRL